MLTLAAARSYGRLDDTTAHDLTTRWNAAYPTMRATLTRRIHTHRRYIDRKGWHIDPTSPAAEYRATHARPEPLARHDLRQAEDLRRTLHQLHHGTHRPCTQSDPGFSITAAYQAVRDVLPLTTINDRGLSDLYELAALLAHIDDALVRERTATPA